MTPKEKAEELFGKFAMYLRANLMYDEEANEDAKQCALIAVDEQIKLYNEMNQLGLLKDNSIGFELLEVKQEIEKL